MKDIGRLSWIENELERIFIKVVLGFGGGGLCLWRLGGGGGGLGGLGGARHRHRVKVLDCLSVGLLDVLQLVLQ